MSSAADGAPPYRLVAALEARARAAESVAELGFSIANDSHALLPFRQALVFQGADEHARVMTVSGLALPGEDSPYLVWLRRAWRWLHGRLDGRPGWVPQPQAVDGPDGAPEDVVQGWQEWWPQGVFALPLQRRSGEGLGWVCFLLDAPPQPPRLQALMQVAPTWAYCWEMLAGRPRRGLRQRWRQLDARRKALAIGALVLALLVPVRETALAPAEIVSLEASVVAAPLDGVIQAIHVRPNQPVKAGDRLFSLDDTTLRNRLAVAEKSVAVAEAELIAATQKAFDSPQSKAELTLLAGRVNERRAEYAAVQAQLARVDVVAAEDGVAVFGDPDDWLGRPVSTGERIMLLANPQRPGLLMHLSVADAITLEPGAPVRFFLTVRPLSPLDARIIETSYQAVLSPDGVASYRLRAAFDGQPEHARIGLRGTAKVYGQRVVLVYYLLRRPLAALREWTGW